jgi:hypothetical protein
VRTDGKRKVAADMTRTPDEIKKGLEEEIPVHYHIDGEPRLTPRLLMDMQWLHKDALALIKKLEKDKKRARENAEILSAAVSRLEAERDAAVAGLKSNCTCPECKYFSDDIQEPCRGCKPTDSKFEWRGVQKEDSDA